MGPFGRRKAVSRRLPPWYRTIYRTLNMQINRRKCGERRGRDDESGNNSRKVKWNGATVFLNLPRERSGGIRVAFDHSCSCSHV
jgi:hypothetical protein